MAQNVGVVFSYLYFWQKKWLSYTFEAFYMSVKALEGQTRMNTASLIETGYQLGASS